LVFSDLNQLPLKFDENHRLEHDNDFATAVPQHAIFVMITTPNRLSGDSVNRLGQTDLRQPQLRPAGDGNPA
jgi:hypothetical protein